MSNYLAWIQFIAIAPKDKFNLTFKTIALGLASRPQLRVMRSESFRAAVTVGKYTARIWSMKNEQSFPIKKNSLSRIRRTNL